MLLDKATRQGAISRLFSIVEERFGNIKQLVDRDSRLVITRTCVHPPSPSATGPPPLHASDLLALVRHEAVALHVKGYYPPAAAAALGKHYLALASAGKASNWKVSTARGLESSDVETIGTPANVAFHNQRQQQTANSSEQPNAATEGMGMMKNTAAPEAASAPDSAESAVIEARHRFSSNRTVDVRGVGVDALPFLHPLDKLRLELDEAWPYGASVGRRTPPPSFFSRALQALLGVVGLSVEVAPKPPPSSSSSSSSLSTSSTSSSSSTSTSTSSSTSPSSSLDVFRPPLAAGLPRLMFGPTRWPRGFIHVDDLSPLSSSFGTFSANIYLQLPAAQVLEEEGGQAAAAATPVASSSSRASSSPGSLLIWPLRWSSSFDFYRNAGTLSCLVTSSPEGQHLLRRSLGPPIVIDPKEGDLVILCAQRPHAAEGFDHGTRVSVQTFVNFKGLSSRLEVES